MSKAGLKLQTTKGFFWNAVENFAVKGGQLLTNIILARLLMPSDFGLIGMLAIFISLSQTIVASGMGRAIIQKRDRTDIDFSTIFIFNFITSIGIYLILYFTAPLIADFYETPQLVLVTRVLCLNIVINSLGFIQVSRLSILLDFKTLAKVNIIATVISGAVAIILAYFGFGIWSLILQSLMRVSITVILLFVVGGWLPLMKFSKNSFKQLFSFGSNVLLAGISKSIFQNIYNISIGKYYSATVLGFYTQGYMVTQTTAGTISTLLQKVAFPVLSSIQDDHKRLLSVYQKMMGMLLFLLLPGMTLLALLAPPFVHVFLGEKWTPAIPIIQWLCLARVVVPIGTLNMNILNAKGRSDLYLKISLLKFPIAIVALLITMPMGIEAVVIGQGVTAVITFFVDAYMPGKLFGYGAWKQLEDMFPKIIIVALMSFSVYLSMSFFVDNFLKMVLGGIIGIVSFFVFSILFKVREINELRYVYNHLANRFSKK